MFTFLLTALLILSIAAVAYLAYLVKTHPYTAEDVDKARKDSIKQSRATVSGKVQEHLAPLLPEFGDVNLKDARFLGSPVDFIIFDGLDEFRDEIKVVFVEVKTGNSQLTIRERKVRDAIQAGKVEWQLVRIKKPKTVDQPEAVVVG